MTWVNLVLSAASAVVLISGAIPRDLSAVSSVVLISRDSVRVLPSGVDSVRFAWKYYMWVVRDLSAASAVVLISLLDSAGSECGSVRGTHFLRFSMSTTPVECSFCLHNTTWVIGDLSAASAVVLISPVDSPGSECGSSVVLISWDSALSTPPVGTQFCLHNTTWVSGI